MIKTYKYKLISRLIHTEMTIQSFVHDKFVIYANVRNHVYSLVHERICQKNRASCSA